MKALIVDDSISVRKALERILNTRDIVTVTAGSAEEAITLLPHSDAEIIITDVVMPGMSGFELCKHIKAGEMSHLPVVLISGVVDDEVNAQAAKAGASMIVTKPFTPEELFPKLEAALAGETIADILTHEDDELLLADDAIFEAAEASEPELTELEAANAESMTEQDAAEQDVAEQDTAELDDSVLEPVAQLDVSDEPAEAYGLEAVEDSEIYSDKVQSTPSYEVEDSADTVSDELEPVAAQDEQATMPPIAELTEASDELAPSAGAMNAEEVPTLPATANSTTAESDAAEISAESTKTDYSETDYPDMYSEMDAADVNDSQVEASQVEPSSEPAIFEAEPVAASAEVTQEAEDELLLFLEEDYQEPEPVAASQEPVYVNVPTPQFDGSLSPEALSELKVFLRHPSVRAALLVNTSGVCIAAEGEGDAEADSLASYVNTLVSIAGVLGGKLGAEALSHFHLEYEGASLVLFRLDSEHRLLLTLNDSDALGVLHYLVRRYIENAGEAALAKHP